MVNKTHNKQANGNGVGVRGTGVNLVFLLDFFKVSQTFRKHWNGVTHKVVKRLCARDPCHEVIV